MTNTYSNLAQIRTRRIFSFMVIFIMTFIIFHSSVVKAQEINDEYYDVEFSAKSLPDGGQLIENNLADGESEIRDELDVWDKHFDKSITDGSYTGPIFESSLFRIDEKPTIENDFYSFSEVNVGATDMPGVFPPEMEDKDEFPGYTIPLQQGEEDMVTGSVSLPETRTILSLTSIMSFDSRTIMSGAIEFYVKIPINPTCLDMDIILPTLTVFETNDANIGITRTNLDNDKLYNVPEVEVVVDPSTYRWSETEGSYNDVLQEVGSYRKDLSSGKGLYPLYKGNEPIILQFITKQYIKDNHLYTRVFGTIEPNTDYLFVFSGVIIKEPEIYITEEDICNNGRYASIMTTDLTFNYEPDIDGVIEYPAQHFFHNVSKSYTDPINDGPYINHTLSIPIDLSFSIIFKVGRGDYGMFGQKDHYNVNDAIAFYQTFSTPSSNKFISLMLPILSDKPIRVSLTVSFTDMLHRFEPQGMYSVPITSIDNPEGYENIQYFTTQQEYGYKHSTFWQSEQNNSYSDYILFTVPYKINIATINEPSFTVKFLITFAEEADVTFLYSTINDASYNAYIEDAAPVIYNGVDNYKPSIGYAQYDDRPTDKFLAVKMKSEITYIYRNIINSEFAGFLYSTKTSYHATDGWPYIIEVQTEWEKFTADGNYTPGKRFYYSQWKGPRNIIPDYKNCTQLNYKLFHSSQLTDGMWHQLTTSTEGYHYASHYFERRIAIGHLEFWIDTSENVEVQDETKWYDEAYGYWDQAKESLSKGDILDAIYYGMKSIASYLWNGLKALLGWVIGVFYKAIDALKALGSFVYSILQSFYDSIMSIMDDIEDALYKIVEPITYIIVLIIFMYMVSFAGKFINYINKKGLPDV